MPIGIPKYFTFRQLWILLSTGKNAYLSHIYIHVHVFTFVHPAYMTYSGSCGWPSCRALQESGNERRVLRLILAAHLHIYIVPTQVRKYQCWCTGRRTIPAVRCIARSSARSGLGAVWDLGDAGDQMLESICRFWTRVAVSPSAAHWTMDRLKS